MQREGHRKLARRAPFAFSSVQFENVESSLSLREGGREGGGERGSEREKEKERERIEREEERDRGRGGSERDRA